MSEADRRTRRARRLAAVASLVAIAVIFAAAGRVIPADLLPRLEWLLEAIPHVNAVLSLGAIVAIVVGLNRIRQGNIHQHKVAMTAAFLQFGLFLLLYVYKVLMVGPASFEGPDLLYQYLYLPMLGIHILLAIICVPLVFYVLFLAGIHDLADLRTTPHPRLGRLAAGLWIVSFVLGILVYVLLYVVY